MTTDSTQLTAADLQSMTAEQIYKARREGRLNDLAAGQVESVAAGGAGTGVPEGQLTRADLANMTPEQIYKAHRAGLLDALKASPGNYS